MMKNNKSINELFGINESFELPEKLMTILVDKKEREEKFRIFETFELDMRHDCLRDYFQDEHAARSSLKQDYTPDCICDLLSQLIPQTDKIIDICSGTGSLSIGIQKNAYFQCEELSKMSIPVLLFNLAIRGMNAIVLQKNVLERNVEKVFLLKKNGKYSDIDICSNYTETKANVVISNPPYSIAWTPKQDERFNGYELAPKGAADYAFVLDGLSRLTDDGTAIYILPSGVLFRGNKEGQIRKQLIENNLIDTVISLPDKLFLNTSIPVNIIIFKKGRKTRDVLFIAALRDYDVGKNQNVLSNEHIAKIVDAYKNRSSIDKYSYCSSYEEIVDNEYNLNIPRYVDTFVKEELPPISEITKDLIKCKIEASKSENELIQMLIDINGDKAYNSAKEEFIKYVKSQDIVGSAACDWLYMQNLEHEADTIYKNAKKERIPIFNICTFERVKKGKIYESGSIYIQLSATDGVLRYLDEDKELDTKYGVFIRKDKKIGARYLYYALDFEIEGFLARYQCGININPDIFKYLKITYSPEVRYQAELVSTLASIENREGIESSILDGYKEFKQFHLENMFPETSGKDKTINKKNNTAIAGQINMFEKL